MTHGHDDSPPEVLGREDADDPADPETLGPFVLEDLRTLLPLLVHARQQGDPHALAALGALVTLGESLHQEVAQPRRALPPGEDTLGMTLQGIALALGGEEPLAEELATYWLFRAALRGSESALEMLTQLVARNPLLLGACLAVEELDALWSEHAPAADRWH